MEQNYSNFVVESLQSKNTVRKPENFLRSCLAFTNRQVRSISSLITHPWSHSGQPCMGIY